MKKYNSEKIRAVYLIKNYRKYLKNSILDVGSGGSPIVLKKEFNNRYTSLDIAETRCKPDIFSDFENNNLPLSNNSYETVLCMDCLEHVENIHSLFFDEMYITPSYIHNDLIFRFYIDWKFLD